MDDARLIRSCKLSLVTSHLIPRHYSPFCVPSTIHPSRSWGCCFVGRQTTEMHDEAKSWWRHQMETFSALLTIWAGNSPWPAEFPARRPVTRSFVVFFDLRLNKQSGGWWFETLSRKLWRHCNVESILITTPCCQNMQFGCDYTTSVRMKKNYIANTDFSHFTCF